MQARSLHPTVPGTRQQDTLAIILRQGRQNTCYTPSVTEKTTRTRRSLVPKTAIIAGAVVLTLVVGALVAGVLVYRSRLITVPDVLGVQSEAAMDSLSAVLLEGSVGGALVSPGVAEGGVLSQEPAPGTLVPPGTRVVLTVSVGSQTVQVPDLVGVPVDEAKSELTAAGLKFTERESSSEETRAVVLEMYPAPGTLVNVGDTIRITLPGGSGSDDVLLPYDLTGVGVLVDPSPGVDIAEGDPSLEVARRLVALLQASGADAVLTRSSSTDLTTRGDRVAASRESTASVFIGLDVARDSGSGVTVLYGLKQVQSTADTFARAVTSALRLPGGRVNTPAATDDPVLAGFRGTGVRLRLGDVADAGDAARLRDPAWADEVARGVYRAIGDTHGS